MGSCLRKGLNVAGSGWLWAVFTVVAAAAQTMRNAAQKELTGKLGTVGAAQVRFLFGCPFALLFLLAMVAAANVPPVPSFEFWPWLFGGALAQIAATALMLAAMEERSFVVAIAYIKTEPVQVAVFGFLFLGDTVTAPTAAAVAIATAGVIVMSMKASGQGRGAGGFRPTALGLASGACFALSAIGFRGAILSLHAPGYVMAATFTVATGLIVQSMILTVYLVLRDRKVLAAIVAAWRPSLFAGFLGALASQFWFLAFALTTAANVRTLALVEVLFAQAISRVVFRQPLSARDGIGIAAIVLGVVLLIWAY
jgi:drug/metabolite transporter (DMT)-like permease